LLWGKADKQERWTPIGCMGLIKKGPKKKQACDSRELRMGGGSRVEIKTWTGTPGKEKLGAVNDTTHGKKPK